MVPIWVYFHDFPKATLSDGEEDVSGESAKFSCRHTPHRQLNSPHDDDGRTRAQGKVRNSKQMRVKVGQRNFHSADIYMQKFSMSRVNTAIMFKHYRQLRGFMQLVKALHGICWTGSCSRLQYRNDGTVKRADTILMMIMMSRWYNICHPLYIHNTPSVLIIPFISI